MEPEHYDRMRQHGHPAAGLRMVAFGFAVLGALPTVLGLLAEIFILALAALGVVRWSIFQDTMAVTWIMAGGFVLLLVAMGLEAVSYRWAESDGLRFP